MSLVLSLLFLVSGAGATTPVYEVVEEPLPLYEYGVGAGVFRTPLYPGSAQSQTRYLGLPYFIYRGRILKADDDGGVRGEIYKQKNYRFDVSFSGAFSANSTDSDIRRGMPDLDLIFQVGPRFVYTFFRGQQTLKLNVPVRSVFSVDWKLLKDRGYTFHPNFEYKYDELGADWFDLFLRAGMIFGTENFLDYFYQVDGLFVRPGRPYYNAEEGMLESHIDLAFAFRLGKKWRMFLGGSYSCYRNAKNRESPLLEVEDSSQVALGLLWEIHASEERAGQWY